MLIDYSILALLVIIAAFLYLILNSYWKNQRTVSQRQAAIARQNNGLDINSMIENAKMALEETEAIYEEQKKAGATEEQLAPLVKRMNNLKMVVDNEMWIRVAGPYADQIAKIAMKWLK